MAAAEANSPKSDEEFRSQLRLSGPYAGTRPRLRYLRHQSHSSSQSQNLEDQDTQASIVVDEAEAADENDDDVVKKRWSPWEIGAPSLMVRFNCDVWAELNALGRAHYVIVGRPRTPAGVDLPFFFQEPGKKKPTEVLMRHLNANPRNHGQSIKQYAGLILEKSVHGEGRSEFVAVPIVPDPDHAAEICPTTGYPKNTHYWFVAGATIVESSYYCFSHKDIAFSVR